MNQQIQERADELARECSAKLYSEYSKEWFNDIPEDRRERYAETFYAAEKVRTKAASLIVAALNLPALLTRLESFKE